MGRQSLFKLISSREVRQLHAQLYLYQHNNGLQVYVLKTTDIEFGFNISFRTPSFSGQGMTHILEHSVLAGSEQYPVRDPFFNMVKSSPNTYMNAYTTEDMTCYIAGSQIAKDFENLFDVYLDAVFHPLLTQDTFDREAHHLELRENNSNLVRTGVVFNEMRAHMTNPDYMAFRHLSRKLFGGSNYAYEFGGDPAEIEELTLKKLRDYHHKYYIPNNSCITLVGDLDIDYYLDKIAASVESFDGGETTEDTKPYAPDFAPAALTVHDFQLQDHESEEEASILAFGYVGEEITTLAQQLDYYALNLLLFDNDFSPLKHALDHNDFSLNAWSFGIDIHKYAYALIGVKGATAEAETQLQELIADVCKQIIADGVSDELTDYILKKLAINRKQYVSAHKLASNISTLWRYGIDPYGSLELDAELESLKVRIRRPGFFAELLQKFILNNSHTARVFMRPSKDHQVAQDKIVADKLEQLRKKLTPTEMNEINERTKQLKDGADNDEQQAKLPKLHPKELDSKYRPVKELVRSAANGINYHLFPAVMQGLVHVNFVLDLSSIDYTLLPYLDFYTELIGRSGAGKYTAEQMQQRINNELATSITASLHIRETGDEQHHKLFLTVNATCLAEDLSKLNMIIHDYLSAVDVNDTKLNKLIATEINQDGMQEALMDSHTVMFNAASKLSSAYGVYSSMLGGPDSVQATRGLYELATKQPAKLTKQLNALLGQINKAKLTIAITADKNTLASSQRILQDWTWLGEQAGTVEPVNFERKNTLYLTETDVSTVCASYQIVPTSDELSGAARILGNIVGGHYLHKQLRELGGAYGGSCFVDFASRQLFMFSYRDPRLSGTLEDYKNLNKWVDSGEITKTMVEDAVCVQVGRFDIVGAPAMRSKTKLLNTLSGVTDKQLQSYRKKLLGTTLSKVKAAAKQLKNPVFVALTSPAKQKSEGRRLKSYKFDAVKLV